MLSIGVVGAGVGGLSVALALREAGFSDIEVYESGIPGSGSNIGLILTPNATRVLHALGLKDRLRALCGLPQAHLQRTWRSGFVLAQRPLGRFAEDRYGAPHCVIARGDLLRLLLDACRRLGISIQCNRSCTKIHQSGRTVVVELGNQRETHDVLIGCDGTESIVRRHLNYPRYSTATRAQTGWGAAPVTALPRSMRADVITTWLGPGRYFTHWLNSTGDHVDFTAFIADDFHPATESAASVFSSSHADLGALIGSSESLEAALVTEHEPTTQWFDRRVVMLGDACHALPPHLQQGAALAIEDAWVLSRMLERWEDEPMAGFNEYQRYRKVRVTRVRREGQKSTLQWCLDNPRQIALRNLKLALASRFLPEIAMQGLDWLYGYDCIKGFE
ncbi:MAG: NAD(P)/FAD-dependent oxidoreductase [Gammaproteobacteria bacterium]|nr:NAD(P)/FAD-dependent oxidoreductase [Gammaproteobacteria bacterium]